MTDEWVIAGLVVSVDEFEPEEFSFDVDAPDIEGEDPWGDGCRGKDGKSGWSEQAAVTNLERPGFLLAVGDRLVGI